MADQPPLSPPAYSVGSVPSSDAAQEHRRGRTTMAHLRFDVKYKNDEDAAVALAKHLEAEHGNVANAAWGFQVLDRRHDNDHLAGPRERAGEPRQSEFSALYDEVIDVCTWARENDCPLAYDWIMERFSEYQETERLLPVTVSQTDKQPDAPSMTSSAHSDGSSRG